MESSERGYQLRLVRLCELQEWVETIEKLLLKNRKAICINKNKFNLLVRKYCAQILLMGTNIDFRNLDTLTINGIPYIKKETQKRVSKQNENNHKD